MTDSAKAAALETFPNPDPQRDFTSMEIPEFTCLCRKKPASQGFRGHLSRLSSRTSCASKLKNLKLYMWSYRDAGAFHEAVANKILKRSPGRR